MYERHQIQSLLQDGYEPIERGRGLYLMPDAPYARRVFCEAVAPALAKTDVHVALDAIVFDGDSNLSDVTRELRRAEVIIAEMTQYNPAMFYVLGLAHGLGRCPLMLTQDSLTLPFNLAALRWLEYEDSPEGLRDLTEHLARAIRVFLAASRRNGEDTDDRRPPAE